MKLCPNFKQHSLPPRRPPLARAGGGTAVRRPALPCPACDTPSFPPRAFDCVGGERARCRRRRPAGGTASPSPPPTPSSPFTRPRRGKYSNFPAAASPAPCAAVVQCAAAIHPIPIKVAPGVGYRLRAVTAENTHTHATRRARHRRGIHRLHRVLLMTRTVLAARRRLRRRPYLHGGGESRARACRLPVICGGPSRRPCPAPPPPFYTPCTLTLGHSSNALPRSP